MAKFRITGPDGSKYEITAPDSAGEAEIGEFIGTHFARSAVPKPPVSAGEMAADVAKSAGIGVVQGGIGLATLPGNLESLARAGINAGAGLVGLNAPVDAETTLPTYSDWKKRVEGYTGEFYEPKTTAGEYARTIGEFAPLGIGAAGTVASKAARVLGPAVASETAGQATEGTAAEPWARVAGAIAGGRLPNAGARMATPNPQDPMRAAQVAVLEKEGVSALTAGQRTGNSRTRWVEDATATIPGGGGRALQMQMKAAEQFTEATLRRAGVQGNRADPATLDKAFVDIGQEYNRFAQQSYIITTQPFSRRLKSIVDDYKLSVPDGMRIPALEKVVTDISGRTGLTGQEYASIRSQLGRLQRAVKADPQASSATRDLIQILDTQAVRSFPKSMRQKALNDLRSRNTRYKNLLAIEDAAARGASEGAAAGLISPAVLKAAIKKQNIRNYTRGRGQLSDLARAGEAVMRPLPSSGTAERSFAQGVVTAPAASLGIIGGASGGLEAGVAAAMVPWLTKAATAKTIMSKPVQRYLSNQRFPSSIPNEVDPRLLSALNAMLIERGGGPLTPEDLMRPRE